MAQSIGAYTVQYENGFLGRVNDFQAEANFVRELVEITGRKTDPIAERMDTVVADLLKNGSSYCEDKDRFELGVYITEGGIAVEFLSPNRWFDYSSIKVTRRDEKSQEGDLLDIVQKADEFQVKEDGRGIVVAFTLEDQMKEEI